MLPAGLKCAHTPRRDGGLADGCALGRVYLGYHDWRQVSVGSLLGLAFGLLWRVLWRRAAKAYRIPLRYVIFPPMRAKAGKPFAGKR